MEAERDVRPLPEQLDRFRHAWAGHHETAGRGHSVLDGVEDRDVNRLVHAEVVTVENQHASILVEAEQLRTHRRPSSGRLGHPPMLGHPALPFAGGLHVAAPPPAPTSKPAELAGREPTWTSV